MRKLFFGLAIAGIAMLAPSLVMGGDTEIAQQIASNLKTSGQMKDYSVGVKVNSGAAILNGHVRDEQQMAAALQIAQRTPGVQQVVNNLTIVRPNDDSPVTKLLKNSGLPTVDDLTSQPQSSSRRTAATKPAVNSGVRQTSAQPTDGSGAVQALGTEAVSGPYAGQRTSSVMAPNPAAFPGYNPGMMPPGYDPNMAAQMQMQMQMQAQMGGMQQGYGAPMPYMPGGATMSPVGPGTQPIPSYVPGANGGVAPAHFDRPNMPGYAWPSYAASPNYAAVTYPKQYSATAWPYIGPFYPYPQVPLGWRKVSLEWDDGWWFLDFKDHH